MAHPAEDTELAIYRHISEAVGKRAAEQQDKLLVALRTSCHEYTRTEFVRLLQQWLACI